MGRKRQEIRVAYGRQHNVILMLNQEILAIVVDNPKLLVILYTQVGRNAYHPLLHHHPLLYQVPLKSAPRPNARAGVKSAGNVALLTKAKIGNVVIINPKIQTLCGVTK
jgi:hypothetical protein|tara:strand:- start:378 stop:704 length:327 start_codon:yes stop_codon:yes gene_type:complete